MTKRRGNDGIIIGGSATVTAGAMAAGKGAHATNVGAVSAPADGELARVRAELDALLAQLRAAADRLPDGDQLVETAEQAGAELGRDKPNRHTLSGLLAGLAAGVAPIATLAEAVEKIRQAVAGLF